MLVGAGGLGGQESGCIEETVSHEGDQCNTWVL